MNALSFSAGLVLGLIVLVIYVIESIFARRKDASQTEALLLIRASVNELTSQIAQCKGCMQTRGGGGSGEEPGKK